MNCIEKIMMGICTILAISMSILLLVVVLVEVKIDMQKCGSINMVYVSGICVNGIDPEDINDKQD